MRESKSKGYWNIYNFLSTRDKFLSVFWISNTFHVSCQFILLVWIEHVSCHTNWDTRHSKLVNALYCLNNIGTFPASKLLSHKVLPKSPRKYIIVVWPSAEEDHARPRCGIWVFYLDTAIRPPTCEFSLLFLENHVYLLIKYVFIFADNAW